MEANCNGMCVLLFGYVSLFLFPTPSSSQPQAATQLLRFRNSLPENSRHLLQWNQSTSHCNWNGVSCYSPTDSRVESLNLRGLYLTGILEDSFPNLCQLPDLAGVDFGRNYLSGPIPPEVTQCRNLSYLKLDVNELSGEIPSELFSLKNLTRLWLRNNHLLNGSIPDFPSHCSFSELKLSETSLSGPLPSSIRNCRNLEFLDVSYNDHEGILPDNIFRGLTRLKELHLNENEFEGGIPLSLWSLRNLTHLALSVNKFNGSIHEDIGRCDQISHLYLSHNSFTGHIPTSISNLKKLVDLNLEENMLSGSIPPGIGNCTSLVEVLIQRNELTGILPREICGLRRLRLLQLAHNYIEGEIPDCIGNLVELEQLDISSNAFSGEIPSETDNMRLLPALNISNNQLSGRIPTFWAIVLKPHPDAYHGNRLCMKIGECGTHKKPHPGIIAGIVIGSLFLTACILATVYKLANRFWSHTASPDQESYHLSTNEELPDGLTFLDILRGTEHWSDKYVIGRGKHGTVYKVESVKSKKHWAIKKVDLNATNFNTEMSILNRVRHRNILTMGGYSVRNGYGYIVTEYMPEGTLYHLLHKRKQQVDLNWEQRYSIAVRIAQGLSYLHNDCVPQVIHRDIKSDNILLDCEFEPKISDFGAAVMQSEDERPTASLIIGTLGYMAPENAYSTKLTDKCDVYSYGVVLMELLCRKLPVDPSFDEGLDIVAWVRNNIRGCEDIFSCMDEEIKDWKKEDQQEALMLMDLALQCTESVPDIRPLMKNVVISLLKFRTKLNSI